MNYYYDKKGLKHVTQGDAENANERYAREEAQAREESLRLQRFTSALANYWAKDILALSRGGWLAQVLTGSRGAVPGAHQEDALEQFDRYWNISGVEDAKTTRDELLRALRDGPSALTVSG